MFMTMKVNITVLICLRFGNLSCKIVLLKISTEQHLQLLQIRNVSLLVFPKKVEN